MKISNKSFIMKISNSSDTDFKDFIKIYRKSTAEPYYFLVIDATLPLDNPLTFSKNLLK